MVALGHVQNGVVVLYDGVCLPEGQQVTVMERERMPASPIPDRPPHSVLDVPPVSLGPVLRPLDTEDDLLDEMLEGRP